MVRSEDGGKGVSVVVGTGIFIFGGGKEEGSGKIICRGGNRQGRGNSPRNENGPGMRVGIQSSNLRSKITGVPELGTHEFHYLFSKNSLLTGTGNSELDKKLPRRL